MATANSRRGSEGTGDGLVVPKSAMEDAHRTAEQLFEQRPVEEIRGVEKRAREQVDLKREELRQVVGGSYRDFIDSADSIKDMAHSCESVVTNLDAIAEKIREIGITLTDRLEGPSSSVDKGKANGHKDSIPLGTRLFALGSRAKVLLDTPESIWAVLESEKLSQKNIEPSVAESIGMILAHGARLAARAFVLWQTQGDELSARFPLLEHQKPQLLDLCQRLRQACLDRLELPHIEVGMTADSLAALVLLDVVDSSQSKVSAMTKMVPSSQSGQIQTATSLCSLWLEQRLRAITKSVDGIDKLSIPCQIAKDLLSKVEILFIASKVHTQKNLSAICIKDVEGDIWYEALPNHENEVKIWKDYLQSFRTGTSLLPLDEVSKLCMTWIDNAQRESQQLSQKYIGALTQLSSLSEIEGEIFNSIKLGDEDASAADKVNEFEERCFSLLHRYLQPWKEFYEDSFVERAKEIIQDSFKGIVPKVVSQIRQCESYSNDSVEIWKSTLSDVLKTINNEVETLFVQALVFMLLPSDPLVLEGRISKIQVFLQESCYQLICDIINSIETIMGQMSTTTKVDNFEYGIFLSNFCDCLQVENCELFQVLLGKPKLWIDYSAQRKKEVSANSSFIISMDALQKARKDITSKLQGKALSSAQISLSALEFAQNQEMKNKLQTVSLRAFNVFIDHVCNEVENSLNANLNKDRTLNSLKSEAQWEETVVKHMDEEGNEVEMKFGLPQMPSSYIVDELFKAISKLHRSRYVKINLKNLQSFEHQLSRAFTTSIKGFLDRNNTDITERGILQLLFDVRYLLDTLAGAKSSSASANSLYTTNYKKTSSIEDALSSLLDPIDWATYEPYMWNNEIQSYHKSNLLFHDFVYSNKVHDNKDVKMKVSPKSNIIDICSDIPRFNYLPVSTPSLKADTTDELLDIFSSSSSEQRNVPHPQSGAYKASNDSVEGSGKAGIFGGIISERAAEATAMAQDLFSGAGFFKKVSKTTR